MDAVWDKKYELTITGLTSEDLYVLTNKLAGNLNKNKLPFPGAHEEEGQFNPVITVLENMVEDSDRD